MKKMNLLMVLFFCVFTFWGCQKEEQKLESDTVTFESLEKEYGIHFTQVADDNSNAIPMSLDELKVFLEGLTSISEKKIDANVIRESALARGEATFIGTMVRIEEGNINVGKLIKIRVDYYQPDKYFNTFIYDQTTGATLYTSTRNKGIVSNMYGNVIYRTFVDNNCAVTVVVNGQMTVLKFKLQVDWNQDTDDAEFTLVVK